MCHKMTLTHASTDKRKFQWMESQKLLTEGKKLY